MDMREYGKGRLFADRGQDVGASVGYPTSDKIYLQNAVDVYESLRLKWPKNAMS